MKNMRNQTIFAIALIGFAASAFAQSAPQPDVHVGDRWAWLHTNKLANEMDRTDIEDVIEVTDKEIRTRARVKGQAGSAIVTYGRDWSRIDTVAARYAPSLKEFDFPLQAGEKWTAEADKMLFSSGKHGKFFLKGEVGALEKITVPAGTFDAYRISLLMDAAGNDEDANVGHTVENLWYAPAVKRYVKLDISFSRDGRVRSQDSYELQEFRSTRADESFYMGFVTAKVTAFEKITVPAGSFDAYKIERDIDWRGAGASEDLSSAHIVTWYAPAVNKFVRRETVNVANGRVRAKSAEELVEFLPQKYQNNDGRLEKP